MTWTQELACTPGTLRAACAADSSSGFVVGDGGSICTVNSGDPQLVISPTTQNLRGVSYAALPDRVYAVGDNGTIVRGSMGNLDNWCLEGGGVTGPLNAVSILWTPAGIRGMAVGPNRTVLVYEGAGWSPITTYWQNHNLTGVSLALDTSSGLGWVAWVVGYQISSPSIGVIAKYTGSWLWMPLSSPPKFNAVCAYSKSLVVASGAGGKIYRKPATDLWFPMVTPSGIGNLNGVAMVDSLNGYAVGDSGAILGSTDGGSTWNSMTNPMSQLTNLYGVSGPAVTPDWAAGDPDSSGGTILCNS